MNKQQETFAHGTQNTKSELLSIKPKQTSQWNPIKAHLDMFDLPQSKRMDTNCTSALKNFAIARTKRKRDFSSTFHKFTASKRIPKKRLFRNLRLWLEHNKTSVLP